MLSALLSAVDTLHGADVDITGVSADSRDIKPGFLFVAIVGEVSDGRDFINTAIENGAAAILSISEAKNVPVPYIISANPRLSLAKIAAQIYAGQPDTIVAMTGTNGKSSTIEFLRQIWSYAGKKAACFGTLGVTTDAGTTPLRHTTPDTVSLHKTLQALAHDGITHAGMEASSHGLKQHRLDGVKLSAVGFSNLTQDHFDYHPDMADYFTAKARLFSELAPKGTPAIINVDGEFGRKMAECAQDSGLDVMRVGWAGDDIRIAELTPHRASQDIELVWDGKRHRITLPLAGEFQVLNAVSALGLAVSTGVDKECALAALAHVSGVAGRMEKAGERGNGAPVFVDFAHTPDGLEKLLRGLRPHTSGKIVLVFGCGGDRDPDKRQKMGAIAAKLADTIIVTDDNPRTEDPAYIRTSVLKGCPDAYESDDRAKAIELGLGLLAKNDCLVIAGKGHETGQIIGTETVPFSDVAVVRELLS
jgi:UDP-N-acetylmuramoyl-L-alanyl-D-glutamate--2,6-diaminopimelate ligase